MPKPPILVPPVPKEPIASATWGDPVTDAVNGLVTGFSRIGAVMHIQNDTQQMNSTFSPVSFTAAMIKFDSDGFVDTAGNRLLIPAGLAGLYEVLFHICTQTSVSGTNARLAIRRNGTTVWQDQVTSVYNSALGLGFSGTLALADGDDIQGHTQSAANMVMQFKAISIKRVGD